MMTKHEKSRSDARLHMEASWAKSIGNCGLCPKAAKGECSAVLAMAEAAGLKREDAQEAIAERIENDAANDI